MKDPNKNRPGYKKTKAGWIPIDWEVYRVKDVGAVQAGRQRSPHFTEGKLHPYLRVANIYDGYVDSSDVKQMTFTEEEFHRYHLRNGDILLNEGQSLDLVGRCAKYMGVPPNCCFQNTLIRFRPNGLIQDDFCQILFAHLQKNSTFAKIASQTTSIAHLGVSRFANLQIPVPTIAEQKKIAKVFTAWDDVIDKSRKLITAKKNRKKALVQQLLSGNRRLCGDDGQKKITDRYPTDWQIVKLKDLFVQVKRKNKANSKRVLTASGRYGLIAQDDYFNRQVAGQSLYNYYLLKNGEFAYNRSSMNGYKYGAIKRLDKYQKGILSTLYVCFRLKDKECNSDFYMHFFNGNMLDRELQAVAQVGARAHGLLNITAHDFFSINIPKPPHEEQLSIAKILTAADNEIIDLEKKLKGIEKQKRGLMQKLLTGEVRVKT
jgi:type I restriction enzyme S subunit